MSYVHLHTHSHYSLLNALPKIDEIINQVKQDGGNSVALTDDGNLYGAIEFYKTCKKMISSPLLELIFLSQSGPVMTKYRGLITVGIVWFYWLKL